MKRLLTAAAIVGLTLTGVANSAYAKDDTEAYNHGYATGALDSHRCGQALTVTDEKLRAAGDRKYKKTKAYREAYDFVRNVDSGPQKTGAVCFRAGVTSVEWLALDKEILLKVQRDQQ